MTASNRIEGVFRLSSPMHVASPDKSASPEGAKNYNTTVQQRVVTRSGVQKVPYFPGNDLRGRLRRKAAKIVMDQLVTVGKISDGLYAGLTCGASSTQPENTLTVEEALRARDNVYMGLFGGGKRLLRSRYRVNDLVPVLASTIEASIVPSKFGNVDGEFLPQGRADADGDRALEGFNLVGDRQSYRVDDILDVRRPDELGRYIDDAVNVLAIYQTNALTAAQERKDDKAAVKSGDLSDRDVSTKKTLGNIFQVQAVHAGTPLYFLLDFHDDVSDAHVGLMLMALRDLIAEQALGGWVRIGFGRFVAKLTLTREGETLKIFNTDTVSDAPVFSDEVAKLINAAQLALAGLTVDQMNIFFAPRKGEDEDGDGPKKGRGRKVSAKDAAVAVATADDAQGQA